MLSAKNKGVDSAIMVAIIEIKEARENLRKFLNLGEFKPQIFFGLGFAKKEAPHSPRRPINDILIK